MILKLKVSLAGLLSFIPASVIGCSLATPWPDPGKIVSDVIVEGVSGEEKGRDTWRRSATVRITRYIRGNQKPRSVELKWTPLGTGMCGPPGPVPELGSRLIVYLIERDGKFVVQGWRPSNERSDAFYFPKAHNNLVSDRNHQVRTEEME